VPKQLGPLQSIVLDVDPVGGRDVTGVARLAGTGRFGDDRLMATMRALLGVGGPHAVDLASIDPRSTPGLPPADVTGDRKMWAAAELERLRPELSRQQEMLFASAKADPGSRRRTLVVLQAMDCGGKDGAIKGIARAMNPLGLKIKSFGPPTEQERGEHFLARIRRVLPAAGQVGVFNRSHYEDVLVARVESLVPEATWRGRYEEINQFERDLVADGTTLVKVMLHISPEEQRERLLKRLDDPRKHWKYDPADVDARRRWDDYQAAYAEALTRCAIPDAPWYVVPADRKWYRDWALARLLREVFVELQLSYPPAAFDVKHERRRLLEDAGSPRASIPAPSRKGDEPAEPALPASRG
jgi:PPK2 family polyphosphate:nucleotide phosphotransferase